MIQNAGLITKNASWHPGSIEELSLESMWREWSWHEMTKRCPLGLVQHVTLLLTTAAGRCGGHICMIAVTAYTSAWP